MRRATRCQASDISVKRISIHALLAESDGNTHGNTSFIQIFLSTLSLRRATPGTSVFRGWTLFLSTLSLRRATNIDLSEFNKAVFLSTLSLRRATGSYHGGIDTVHISIHALLAESDTIFAVRPYDAPIFLSTLSLRRATSLLILESSAKIFLSTLSLRRATPVC